MAGTPSFFRDSSSPRIVFFGEKPLAEDCLIDLLDRCQKKALVVGVCSRTKDENLWWGPNKIKEIAKQASIPLLKRSEVISLKPDIILSVLYPFVIEAEVLEAAGSAFNLHLAPLPEYKGCHTGSHALMSGRRTFGVTLHEMTTELDRGRIIEKRYFELTHDETAKTLYEKAVRLGFAIWMDQIENILSGRVSFQEVSDDGSLPFSRNSLEQKQIPAQASRSEIYNFVRALDFEPFEPAHFTVENQKISLRQKDFDLRTLRLLDPKLENKLEIYLGQGEKKI